MAVVACMAVGHGVWKTTEPLSDLDKLLNIVKHDPFVSARWVVGVCSTIWRVSRNPGNQTKYHHLIHIKLPSVLA